MTPRAGTTHLRRHGTRSLLPPGAIGLPLASQALVLTLAMALGMRLLVSILGLPGILNFAFFPVLLFGVLISRPGRTLAESRITRAIVLVTLTVVASTLANFANPLTAALLWASLATPFLLMRLAATQGHRLGSIATLDRLLTTFLFVQGGAVAFERFALGRSGDAAQGFLAGQGAGHHIVGFIGVGTALYLAMRLIEEPAVRGRPSMYGAALTGLAMGVITGTLQAFLVAAVVGTSYLLTRKARWPVTSSIAVGTTVLLTVLFFWSAFTPAGRNWYGSEFFANKGQTATLIVHEYRDLPHQVFFGLGPGMTATKVSWTGAPGSDNLTRSLSIEPGRVAEELLELERAKPPFRTSSLASPWSTWLGVWGDLGIFGVIAFALAWLALARSTLSGAGTQRAGLYLVLYLVLLGVLYNWLEEPVLTIFLGLAIADAIVRASRSRSADVENESKGNPTHLMTS